MAEIIIYQKPTCSTCRQVVRLVKESGQPFRAINYYEEPFSKSLLKTLLKQSGLAVRELLRTKEELYKELQLSDDRLNDDQLLDAMIKYPDLIQRPLVAKGSHVILARPAETITRLLEIK